MWRLRQGRAGLGPWTCLLWPLSLPDGPGWVIWVWKAEWLGGGPGAASPRCRGLWGGFLPTGPSGLRKDVSHRPAWGGAPSTFAEGLAACYCHELEEAGFFSVLQSEALLMSNSLPKSPLQPPAASAPPRLDPGLLCLPPFSPFWHRHRMPPRLSQPFPCRDDPAPGPLGRPPTWGCPLNSPHLGLQPPYWVGLILCDRGRH